MHSTKKQPLPPHSLEAEQSVLGGLMLDNNRWDEIILLLEPNDFFTAVHRTIYRTMTELAMEDKPLDLITLSELLERKALLEQLGGFGYLAELSKNTPSAANIVAYAQIVLEKSRLRQLLHLGQSLCADVSGPKAEVSVIAEQAESILFALAEKGGGQKHQEVSVLNAMDSLVLHLEHINGGSGITGIPTGFDELDSITCGLQDGDLILVAARPSMGKTSLALSLCTGALRGRSEGTVQIFSIEMPTNQLMMRLTSMESGVELTRLRSGQLDDEHWARIGRAVGTFTDWKDRLIIDDNSLQTPALLRTRARRYVRKYGQPSLILVDYLQLIRCAGQENRTQEIAEISRSLKALAKELGCPVVALSQLNRQVESRTDKRPYNGDLRESGALEQDADVIMFIYRDEVYDEHSPDKGIAELIIGKQRQGPTGTVKVQFDGRYTRFSDFDGGYHFGYSQSGRPR